MSLGILIRVSHAFVTALACPVRFDAHNPNLTPLANEHVSCFCVQQRLTWVRVVAGAAIAIVSPDYS